MDADNEVIGSIRRGDVPRAGINFRTVHVLVIDSDSRMLLQQLASTRARHPGRWGSSVAGYMHAGEGYEAAAARRLREELGLETAVRPAGVTPMHDEGSIKFIGVFTAQMESKEPTIAEPDHIDALERRTQADLDIAVRRKPELFTPSFRHVYDFFRSQQPTRVHL